MALASAAIAQYAIVAGGERWTVAIEPTPSASFDGACADAVDGLGKLCDRYGVRAPAFEFDRWCSPKPGEKRRRIAARRVPERSSCA
jgi:hypothetical protein